MSDRNFLPEQQDEEEYHFLNETHKQPPLKIRTILTGLLVIIAGAVLFGVLAANVFLLIIEHHERNRIDQISLPEDSEAESLEEKEATPSPTPSPLAVPSGNEELSAAELENRALEHYEYLNEKMKKIGMATEKYLVRVTGIRNTEDWLNHTNTSVATQSGLIVAENGKNLLVLTDYLSIEGAERIAVTFSDDTILDASLQKHDPITDLAVIAIPMEQISEETKRSYTIANLGNSYRISNGDSVIAIGSPLGYSGSIGYGEVTSTEHTVSVTDGEYNLITTNIQGNSSGNGLLINTDGEVVGLIVQKYAAGNSSVITGVPISLLKHLIEILSNNQTLTYVGLQGQTVTANVAESSGIPTGVYVTNVEADSPALAAGLAVGDVIRKIDDLEITGMKLIHTKISSMKVGDTVSITVQRLGADGYKTFEFKMTIGEI